MTLLVALLVSAAAPTTSDAFEASAFCKKYTCEPGNIYDADPGIQGYFYRLQGKEGVNAVIQVRTKGGFVLSYLDVQLNKSTGAPDLKTFASKFRPLAEALTIQMVGTLPKLDLVKLCTKAHATSMKVGGKLYTFACEEATGEGLYTITAK